MQLRLVEGYRDGSFRPDEEITRGQFAVMLYRALGLTNSEEETFEDTIPSWAKEAVNAAAAGFINGYPDGTFRSEQTITRAELAVIVARILQVESTEESSFTDALSIPNGANSAVVAITKLGLISGYSDGAYRPNATATRAETLVVLLRVMDYLNKNS